MTSSLLIFLFTASLYYLILCTPVRVDEDIPGYCNIRGNYVKEGQSSPDQQGSCLLWTCNNASTKAFSGKLCGEFHLPPNSGCNKTGVDNTKLYPDCCPKSICKNDKPPF